VTKAEFDAFAQDYSDIAARNTSFFTDDYSYFGRYRARIVRTIAGDNVGDILDFGCGIGLGVTALREIFTESRIVGCDPSEESLAIARKNEPDCEFSAPDDIPPTQRFDAITAISVFHHIPPQDRDAALRYCCDRLKPGGALFIFEHNPYNPLTQRLVARCPLDVNAILLPPSETVARVRAAGLDNVRSQYCLFFPKALGFLRPLESSLGWLPLGGQYYVWGVRAGFKAGSGA